MTHWFSNLSLPITHFRKHILPHEFMSDSISYRDFLVYFILSLLGFFLLLYRSQIQLRLCISWYLFQNILTCWMKNHTLGARVMVVKVLQFWKYKYIDSMEKMCPDEGMRSLHHLQVRCLLQKVRSAWRAESASHTGWSARLMWVQAQSNGFRFPTHIFSICHYSVYSKLPVSSRRL